jgi:hypothetical protein
MSPATRPPVRTVIAPPRWLTSASVSRIVFQVKRSAPASTPLSAIVSSCLATIVRAARRVDGREVVALAEAHRRDRPEWHGRDAVGDDGRRHRVVALEARGGGHRERADLDI